MVDILSNWFENVRGFALSHGGRIVEFGCALLLIGRGVYVMDDTAVARGGIQPILANSPALSNYAGLAMILTGAAMLIGLLLPILTLHRFRGFVWRRVCIYLALFEICGYAAGVSAYHWSSGFTALGVVVMLTYSYLRLGHWMDKEDARHVNSDSNSDGGFVRRSDTEDHRVNIRTLETAATAKAG